MARKGREFEKMIAFLEATLGPKGVEVKSPDYIKGKTSESTREVDVSLRGKLGSAELLVIMECRDREGTEDVSWIEQLASKGEDVGASKIIAVSRTGFSSGARNTAASKNIDLRTYAEVDPNEILLWFGFTEIEVIKRIFDVVHVIMNFDVQDTSAIKFLPDMEARLFPVFDINAPIFHGKKDGGHFCFVNIWNSLPLDQIYEDVPQDGTKIRKSIVIRTQGAANCFQIMTTQGLQDISDFHVEADLWISIEKNPLAAVKQYRNEENILAQTAGFDFRVGDKEFALELHKYSGSGRQSVVLRGKGRTE